MRYLIVDGNGIVINAVDWDGISEWSPPQGCQAIMNDQSNAQDIFTMGDSWDGNSFQHAMPPPPITDPHASPSVESL